MFNAETLIWLITCMAFGCMVYLIRSLPPFGINIHKFVFFFVRSVHSFALVVVSIFHKKKEQNKKKLFKFDNGVCCWELGVIVLFMPDSLAENVFGNFCPYAAVFARTRRIRHAEQQLTIGTWYNVLVLRSMLYLFCYLLRLMSTVL